MKKSPLSITITQIISGLAAVLLIIIIVAVASTKQDLPELQNDPARFMPQNVGLLLEVNLQEKNPLEELITTALKQSLTTVNLSEEDLQNGLDMVKNNTLTVGMEMSFPPAVYLTGNATEEQFEKLQNAFPSNETENWEHNGQNILSIPYPRGSNTGFQFHEGKILMASPALQSFNLVDVIQNNKPSLIKDDTYRRVMGKATPNSFFRAYLDLQKIWNSVKEYQTPNPEGETIIQFMQAAGISVNQTEDGFQAFIGMQSSPQFLRKMNFDYEKYSFKPALYQKISGKDIIFYNESYNLPDRLKDMMKISVAINPDPQAEVQLNEMEKDFKGIENILEESVDINFTKEIQPLLSGRTAIAVHETSQIFPATTILLETSPGQNTQKLLQSINEKMSKGLEEVFQESPQNGNYAHHTETFHTDSGDTEMYVHVFTPPEDEKNSVLNEITIKTAYVGNNTLLISTYSQPEALLQGSLTDNQDFQQLFASTDPQEKVSEIQYIDAKNMQKYLQTVENLVRANSQIPNHENVANTLGVLRQFLLPWKDMLNVIHGNKNFYWVDMNLRVDTNQFSNYPQLFQQLQQLNASQ